MATKPRWLTGSVFPLLHGLTWLFLFWLVESFIARDLTKIIAWSAGGFFLGVVSGIAIQYVILRYSFACQTFPRNTLLASTLIAEFMVGLLLIGPFIWVLLRFVPVSNLHSICCETPLDYGASRYENVQLQADDGATIAGWYVAPGAQAGKVIILIHGYGYDRRGTDFQARQLIAAGYGVLLYDLRAHGESTGTFNTFNRMFLYQSDLAHVIDYVSAKPEVDPRHIGIVGISLGAFATLNSAPQTLNKLAALWLDGLRFENFNARVQPQTLLDYCKAVFDHQTRWLAGLYSGTDIAPAPPLFTDIIPLLTQPKVMIVASGLDDGERQTNERFIPLMGGNKDIWFIKNAWHIGGRFDAPEEYRRRMLDFFEQAFSGN